MGKKVQEVDVGRIERPSIIRRERIDSVRNAIEARLRESLSATHVEVVDESHLHAGHAGAASGGGHYRTVIVSEAFAGLSRVKAQQLVYAAMGAWMGREIHALSMQTFTPEQWRAAAESGA